MKIHSLGEKSFKRRIEVIGEPGSDRFANPIFLPHIKEDNGKQFQDYMYFVCSCLNSFGYHAHLNHSKKILATNPQTKKEELIFIDGEPFDCEIFCNGIHCFDVKENFAEANGYAFFSDEDTDKHKSHILNSLRSEIINLSNCQRIRGIQTYFLVYFGHKESIYQNKIIRFDVDTFRDFFFAGKKYIPAEKGKIWTIYDIMPRSDFQEHYKHYGINPYMNECQFGNKS